jgi:hypothetical protein
VVPESKTLRDRTRLVDDQYSSQQYGQVDVRPGSEKVAIPEIKSLGERLLLMNQHNSQESEYGAVGSRRMQNNST